jgi:type II secretory pathway component GspD/PulD (secretin)
MRIDPAYLNPAQKTQLDSAMADCNTKLNPIRLASGTDDDLKAGLNKLGQDVKAATPPPVTAPVMNVPPAAGTIVNEQKAIADVQFDKLRTELIEVMKAAGVAWEKGDPDSSMKFLEEFIAKVNASTQPPPRKATLINPIQGRLDAYAKMKHHYDYELKEAKEKMDQQKQRVGDRVAEAQKQDELKKKAHEIEGLQHAGKFKEAEGLALQMKLLAPEDVTVKAIYELAKMKRRADDNKKFKDEDEKFTLEALNGAERRGTYVDVNDPLKINPEYALRNRERGEDGILRTRTREEHLLEGKLSAPYPMLKFENMPLKDVIDRVRKDTGINITVDQATLEDEKISLDSVIINEEFKDLSLQCALKVILEKARLVHIVEDNVVKITTEKRTKGRMKTKVFHVMDLVTPIPEYKLSDSQTLQGAMAAGSGRNLPPALTGLNPNTGRMMNGGELISGSNGPGTALGATGGQLSSNAVPNGVNPMTPTRVQYAEQLKKLVTQLVRRDSWADNGNTGSGSIAYYDIGGAMVVNQTADVISEVDALLNALRRLQDLSVAVEIRVISLSETYFERIGVDFQANVTTNNTNFEQSLTTGSFRPQPFINSFRGVNGTTVGWSPATGFTQDLGVPIQPTSYNLTAPPFGGYQNSLSPTLNGGLSLGLAFLNDIQVYMFLEAAAGNRRVNIMQAPKITLFNGQTSTVFVGDLAYFATALQVYSANGQFVYLPVNQAFPIGQNGTNPNGTTGQSGVAVTVQAIISADRRFVRLNLTPSLTALASATVPLYPITTFITPVFEGGSQGQPIPFTQFFQQPSFTEVSVQTTVAIPDGGTVLLGGLKTLAQGRNEFGPPVLSDIPYLNRLFKNVGIGQETRHVMLMVTPRIIINSEEEARQTGDGIAGGLPPQP